MLLIFWLRLIPSLRDYFGRDTGNCLGVSHKNSTLTGNLVKSILNYFYILTLNNRWLRLEATPFIFNFSADSFSL